MEQNKNVTVPKNGEIIPKEQKKRVSEQSLAKSNNDKQESSPNELRLKKKVAEVTQEKPKTGLQISTNPTETSVNKTPTKGSRSQNNSAVAATKSTPKAQDVQIKTNNNL